MSDTNSNNGNIAIASTDEWAAVFYLLDRPAWHKEAACLGMSHTDYDLFFPERGQLTTRPKAICKTCPVKQKCLAASVDERFGIWGGTSERERRRLRRQARLAREGLGRAS